MARGPAEYGPPPGASGALAIGYLNKDAPIDLIVGGSDQGVATIAVMLGTGDGTDVDTDEDPDVVCAGGNGPPDGKEDGTFGPATKLVLADASPDAALVAADLDGDGHADLIATTRSGIAVIRSHGARFDAPVVLPASGLGRIAAGDLRGDRLLGLAATRSDGHAMV